MTEFATLRQQAGVDIAALQVNFGVTPLEIEDWENGAKQPPVAVLQTLRIFAQFSAADFSCKTEETAIMRKPGQGKRVLSFFTGCGGLDLGFEKAGFQTVYATDIDAHSCKTLQRNAGHHFSDEMTIEQGDIVAIDPTSLPRDIDLIIGGPPCQSFSASGRRAGGAAGRLDQRGRLFEAYCAIIAHSRPKAFVFENVRGILGTNKGEDWKAIVRAFGDLGYTLSYRLLDALDYGVPQQRERMFLVGHQLTEPFLFPEPTHGPDSPDGRPHVTAGQAFDGIDETEDLSALELSGGKYSHLLPLVPPGHNYLHFTAKRGYPRPIFAYRSRFSDFLYKADPDAPVKTIIASPGKYTGPLHWDNRYFSLREYTRLQGFPDDFEFSGNRPDVIRQIGNSVSPRIAYRLALAIAEQVFQTAANVRLMSTERVLSFDRRKSKKAQSTRAMHVRIGERGPSEDEQPFFAPRPYLSAGEGRGSQTRIQASVEADEVSLCVQTDGSEELFARLVLDVKQFSSPLAATLRVTVTGMGKHPSTAQAMWDAFDEWVRRSSGFHSLFELYGHFTEPHPMFSIVEYTAFSHHPVASFAKHAANFANCSRYLPKPQLIELFRDTLGTNNFGEIATYLRQYRFDIRSRETNIAIARGMYMVAYPFNLPARRQMNFRVNDVEEQEPSLVQATL